MASKEFVTEKELISWVEKSIDDRNFEHYEILISGTTKSCDGYVGDIVFVEVSGKIKGKQENIHLAIKHGKKSSEVRKAIPLRQLFEREIYCYDKIFKEYKKFELEKGVKNGFDSVPKCYRTFMLENMEVIVLENLKQRGYEMYDRKKPLNLEHVKFNLVEYGKFHALSFALRDQKKGLFKELSSKVNTPLFKEMAKSSGIDKVLTTRCTRAIDILKELQSGDLSENFNDVIKTDSAAVFFELLDAMEPQSVIIHGDCWTNNFMFQYQEGNQSKPIKVAFLDWQLAELHSPIFDISSFLYLTCSSEQLQHFEELMRLYYSSLSTSLLYLGSDPEKCFSYNDLKRHWKKYSLYGLLEAVGFLQVVLCDDDEALGFEEAENGKPVANVFDINIKNQEVYNQRLVAVVKHYFTSLN